MGYFKTYPYVDYKFVDNIQTTTFQNLSIYVDLIDQIKDDITFYTKFFIHENERPDTISYSLYGDVDYYWTLFLLNDHLRQNGWPVTNSELIKLCKKDFPYVTIVTQANISTFDFNIGTVITGSQSGVSGEIIKIDADLGQLIINVTTPYTDGESVNFYDTDGNIQSFVVKNSMEQYNSVHHYEDEDGNYVDIDATATVPSIYTPITHLDMYRIRNEKQREILIIRPKYIESVSSKFQSLSKG